MTGLVRLWCKAPDLRVAGYLCAFVRSHGAPGAFYSRIPRVLALAMRELSAPLTITCSFGERDPANRRAAFENQLRNCSDHAPGGRPPDSDTEPDGRCGSLSEGLSEIVSMRHPSLSDTITVSLCQCADGFKKRVQGRRQMQTYDPSTFTVGGACARCLDINTAAPLTYVVVVRLHSNRSRGV